MKSVVRLDRNYDVERLRADLEIAERVGERHLHFTNNHDGGWSGIALMSIDGKTGAESIKYGAGRYMPTPVLQQCSYFQEVLNSFRCPKRQVRLLRLEAGKKVLEHRDRVLGWAHGQARLHIPIVTHEEVHFFLNHQRVIMRAGELWYCDFGLPHSVENRSPVARVHLVCDLQINRWLRGLFPPESLLERASNFRQAVGFRAAATFRRAVQASGLKSSAKQRARGAGAGH
ncbi:MAG: aspartyl/asparaginyl beta-hydroxylase domain-containing protein [Bryobacteraceae bacterium]|nr:aspartyl/asparaginyl beta-hydroxylase domain-containing protein [Bryobacteraceae bacterium]